MGIVGGSYPGHCNARDALRGKVTWPGSGCPFLTGSLGCHTTYIKAGHIHPVAHDHINEFIWRAVFSEEYFSIEDL